MKTKLIAITILARLLSGCAAYAQETNSPASQWSQAYADLSSSIESLKPTPDSVYSLYVGYGQNTSSGKQIEAAMLTVHQADSPAAVGIVGTHIGAQWEYGGANVTFGRTDVLPVLGRCREYIGEGVIYDFKTHEPANYFLTGVDKDWNLFSKHHFGIGVVIDHRSNSGGVDILGGAHGTF